MSIVSMPALSAVSKHNLIDQVKLDALKQLATSLYEAKQKVKSGEVLLSDPDRFLEGIDSALATVSLEIGHAIEDYREYLLTLMFPEKNWDIDNQADREEKRQHRALLKYVLEPSTPRKRPDNIEDYPWNGEQIGECQARFDALVKGYPVFEDLNRINDTADYIGDWY